MGVASSHTTGFADALLAAGEPDAVAIVDGPDHYTYRELRQAATRIAGELSKLSLAPGARIGLLGTNSFFWVAAYLAAIKMGVVVPLSDKNTVDELAAQVNFVGCTAILVDRRQQRRHANAFGDLPLINDSVLTHRGPQAWPQGSSTANSDAALMFTSGTSSRPKAVRATHLNLLTNTSSIIEYLDLQSTDRMLVVLPFHYVFGASLLHTHLSVGGSLVLCNTFTFPETALDLIALEQCTGFAGVPSSFQLLLRASSYATRDLPSLRMIQQAGGPLALAQIQELVLAQPQSQVFVMYGQTEATARLSYLPPELLQDKLGSIGRGIPGVTLRVLRDDGGSVSPGQIGEIVAEGLNISPGYFNDPDASTEKFQDGYLRTGDLATVDAEGFIYIVGRRADFIKSWGYRIAPTQIEEVAQQFNGIASAAAVGIPDSMAGEVIALAVTVTHNIDFERPQLLTWLRAKLPKHMVPDYVHVLDALPMTASGKISKPELKKLLMVRIGSNPVEQG